MSKPDPANKAESSNPTSTRRGGIHDIKTSDAFRIVNFELYARPNKFIMGAGLLAITGSVGFLIYMRYKVDSDKVYTAIKEDGSKELHLKVSKWD